MAAKKGEYIALYSDCGDDNQLKTVGGDDAVIFVRESLLKAKKDASEHARTMKDSGEAACNYVIVQVVTRGKASEIVWE